jgi:hypothetical protein
LSRPEAKIEEHLRRRVTAAGGLAEKIAPVRAGVPDRLVVLRGRVYLVELKAPGGRVRPVQRYWHGLAARAGVRVLILSSIREVDEFMNSVLGGDLDAHIQNMQRQSS